MAKFAIVFLAAIAAASAGVLMPQEYQDSALGTYGYGYGLHFNTYPTGKFDYLFQQLQTVSQDLSVYFQKALPNDRLVLRTLTWQSRELAQYIETIIEKLQAETYQYEGQVSMVLEQFVTELREIKMQYQQLAGYTTGMYGVNQMKNQFYMTVQRTVAQLEKLVRFVQTDFQQSYGQLYFVLKNVVADFLYAFQNIYTQVQYYGVYGEQSPKQLAYQIQEVTSDMIAYFQGVTHFDAHRIYAIREYIQHVEAIISRMQEVEGTYGNMEMDMVLQQVYGKLRKVLMPFMQMVDTKYDMENVAVIRTELLKELQFVAEAFEQFFQYTTAGKYQTFFFEILGDYLYTLQQFRMQMMYGEYQTYYGTAGHQGLSNYDNMGYQGLYKYGGLYGSGYGYFGRYQGFSKYGQGFKQYQVQFQTMMRDLYQMFHTVSFDEVTTRQAFTYMIREYTQNLEYIVEKMQQVNYNTNTDTYMYQQIVQNLRQYVLALQQFYAREYSATEMKTEFFMYVQKIATEFEKLMTIVDPSDAFYYLVRDIFFQYFTATYDFYRHLHSMTEIAYYGYQPYARQYYGANYRMMENVNYPGYGYGRQSYGDNYFGGKYYGKYFGGKYAQYPGYGYQYGMPRGNMWGSTYYNQAPMYAY